jgi:hypothetical protein
MQRSERFTALFTPYPKAGVLPIRRPRSREVAHLVYLILLNWQIPARRYDFLCAFAWKPRGSVQCTNTSFLLSWKG